MKQIIKNKKTLFLGGIVLLILISVVGLSYAYFSAEDKQSTANTFRSGCLNITIESESNAITLNNAYPVSDVEGLGTNGYTFTIKNTCNKDTNYMINLESLNQVSNTLDSNYLKVALESDTMDNLINKLGDNPRAETLITGAYEAYNLYNGTIKANTSKEFTLREWIDYDVTKEVGMNKTVTNKINVIARPDLEVNELAEIKTTYEEPKLKANVTGIEIPKEENTIASVTNDETYPFSYNEETKKYTSTNKANSTTSSIAFKLEQVGDVKICYEISSEKYDRDRATFYIGYEQIATVSGEKKGCLSLENVRLDQEIKAEYVKDNYSSSGKDEVSFSIELLPTEKLPIKYCVSDKNICDPDKDTSIVNNEIILNLNKEKQLICTKLNNDKTYCNKKDKSLPILAKYFLKNNADKRDFESIEVLDKIDIPDNAIKQWDASEANNGSVMAYYLDEDNDSEYELYLAGDGRVMAPKDSSYLFSDPIWNYKYSNVERIDLSKLDTSKVTNMSHMFDSMDYLKSLNLSNFDTSNVTNMSSMFYYVYSITNLDISNFDTSKVTNMSEMFEGVYKLENLNLSHFDTSNVTNMSWMFQDMNYLKSLDLSSFDTSNVTDMSFMFAEVHNLPNLDVSNFSTSNVTDMSSMFEEMNSLTSLDISHFNTSKVTNMNHMFWEMKSITSLDLSNFDTSNVTDMGFMFSWMISLTSLDLSSFDTSNVTDMSFMFAKVHNLPNLDVSNFSTSNVTDMSSMFEEMNSLTSLDISNFDTSNVTDMNWMFGGTSSLTSLDLSNFNTSKVTDMRNIFFKMNNLTSLDISAFDFSKVTTYTDMFIDSSKLNTIKVKDTTAKDFIEARLTDASLTGVTVTTG